MPASAQPRSLGVSLTSRKRSTCRFGSGTMPSSRRFFTSRYCFRRSRFLSRLLAVLSVFSQPASVFSIRCMRLSSDRSVCTICSNRSAISCIAQERKTLLFFLDYEKTP